MSRAGRRLPGMLARGLRFSGYTWRWVAGQVALAGLYALLAGALVQAMLLPALFALHFGQLWLLITAALLGQWLTQPLREPLLLPGPPPDETGMADLRDRPYPLVDRWEQRLSVTAGDPEWYARVVRDRLVVLVAERLWQRHGVRLATDPARARGPLGDELHEFVTTPLTRTPDPDELSRLITRMEEI